MLIREGSLTLDAQPLTIVYFLLITCSLGCPKGNPHYPVLVQLLSTAASPTWFLSYTGYIIFFPNYTVQFPMLLWFTMTTSLTSKWIFILFVKK